MSEQEIRKRKEYKRKRKAWMVVQIVALILAVIIALGSLLIYTRAERNQFVQYKEGSGINYNVQYNPNEFFEEEWIGEGQSYISSLINIVEADFTYTLDVDSVKSSTYYIEAKLLITNTRSGATYYEIKENIVPETNLYFPEGSAASVDRVVGIDYNKYNQIAKDFISTYDLNDTSSVLQVTMYVSTVCSGDNLPDEVTKTYSGALNIPLAVDSFSIFTSNIPSQEGAFEIQGAIDREVFSAISKISALVALVLLLVLLIFLHFTKNEDIAYYARVRKIYRSYKSFIQRIFGEFDSTGYQLVEVQSFTEMLGIRDTIQSPVLMSENTDETMTRFLIPTNTKILYVFEVKVDNYDEIYSRYLDPVEPIAIPLEPEEPAEPIVEAAPVEEPAPEVPDQPLEEPIEAAQEMPTVEMIIEHLVEGGEEEGESDSDELAYVDETGARIKIACKRSFTANLIQSNPQVKKYYNEIKNHILSYKGVKSRINWRLEGFNKGRTNLFKLKIRGKTICLYCALNPDDFDAAKYFHERAEAKVFAQTPMLVRIKSDRGLKRAKYLCDLVMQNFAIDLIPDAAVIDFADEYPYDTTKHLVERGLIKILLPGASAAEPMPHHHVHKSLSDDTRRDEREDEQQAEIALEPEVIEPEAEPEAEEPAPEETASEEPEVTEEDQQKVLMIMDHIVEEGEDGTDAIAYLDETGARIKIACKRSFTANLIQSNPQVKKYYNDLKNHILSYNGVKSRINWRIEGFNKGRTNLFKLKIRGKTICLYCALEPEAFDKAKFFHERAEAKAFAQTPMLVRIKSDRGLKRAKYLCDLVMNGYSIPKNENPDTTDFAGAYPYDTTKHLVSRGLIKILLPGASAAEPKPHHHAHKDISEKN